MVDTEWHGTGEQEELRRAACRAIAGKLKKRGSRPHVYECPFDDHGPECKDFYFDPETGTVGACQGKHKGQLTRWVDLARHLGVDVSQIARDIARRSNGKWREAAVYRYEDARGKHLFDVVRKENGTEKRFSQRRPDGNGGYVYSLGDTPRVLYRLRDLLAADPDVPVFIVEGEKDVERLASLDITATCSPHGAGKWAKYQGNYNGALQGRRVCIIPDNDSPGRRHALQVINGIKDLAAEVRVLELPDLPEKGDVSTWLDNGGDPFGLIALAGNAPTAEEWQATQQPVPVSGSQTSRQNERLLSFSPDDEGNAQSVKLLHGSRFWHTEAYGWLHYTGTHWDRQGAESQLDRAIVSTLIERRHLAVDAGMDAIVKATRPSAHNVRSVKFMLASLLPSTIASFDQSPDHLNVKNGVLHLRTGRLESHHSGQLFTYCLPVAYDPNADTVPWESWLASAVGGDEATADYLQKAVGYSLTGNTWEECLLYLHGPTRAGKGTFTETLLAMAGREPIATETDFETFTRKRDNDQNNADLAALKPCRIVIASESGKNQWLNPAKLKQLTGGNLVYCALKYRDHFSYRPQYTIWLVSNHAPKVDVDDDAAWGRVRVVRFPNSYLGREDRSLKARMRRPGMLQAVLAWAVQGAMMWYATGSRGIEAPPGVADATARAREQIDYVGQWLAECADQAGNAEDFISNATLYASYKEWCEANGVPPKKQTGLTQALRAKGFDAGARRRIGGKVLRGCTGIKLVGTTPLGV